MAVKSRVFVRPLYDERSDEARWTPCARCKTSMFLTSEQEKMLRASSQTFFCVYGHSNYYAQGESEQDKLRRERDSLKQQIARVEQEKVEALAQARRDILAAKQETISTKRRIASGVCPCCNRTFTALGRHMKTKHPQYKPAPVVQ